MDKFDVIVVGGGPSGSVASLFLSRAGYQVLLLDKAHFPRGKVCGDACSAKGLKIIKELGLLEELKKVPHVNVNHLLLGAPNGKSITMPYAAKEGFECAGFVISRKESDNVLFQAAKKEVTAIEGFEVNSLIFENESVVGITGKTEKGEKKEFRSKIVIGADGATSVVAKLLGSSQLDPKHRCGAIRGYFEGVTGLNDTIELYFLDGVFPGYFWIFPEANGIANVGLGVISSKIVKYHLSLNQLMEKAMQTPGIKERFTNAKQVSKTEGWIIPVGSKRVKNYGNGWLLVGDAASLADPFSGEGICNALISGKIAADVISSALKANDFSENFLKEYERRIAEKMDHDFQTTYFLQRVSSYKFLLNLFIDKATSSSEVKKTLAEMMETSNAKNKARSPLFYLKLLLS